ncbi:Cysteine desulfurase [Rubripirellula lacrimiformis]|uniref:Cysteine desulfurase n=1 Tax=Rubripirellula lacrimiformis TaxID=1930273 RepID=A0A517NG49_9BACT|nr:cysteine desulfurase family protein [Rubripirellula lacrimiformis]QDT06112.1 Cysteine desulfurase [Rubripirellula lacrimiformis]
MVCIERLAGLCPPDDVVSPLLVCSVLSLPYSPVIYLDFNRTTPMAPSVVEAMKPYWLTHFMLPGQEHPHAQAVAEALENAREGVAILAGCEPFEVVFTGGGTEANNLGILGGVDRSERGHVLVSTLEHDSVLGATAHLAELGWEVESVPCDSNGLVDPESLGRAIRSTTRLACVQLANPVLGTIQPVREIADICHSRGVSLHCDATQAFGKMPVDVTELRADTVSVSAHKFYGPKGSGALYVRRGLSLRPISFGEPREMGLRPGAENIPGCIGLGAAASLAGRCAGDVAASIGDLRDHFAYGLLSSLGDRARILCLDSPRLPNTIAIEMPGDAKRIQRAARQLAIATAQSDTPPDETTRALRAIGMSGAQVGRTIRLSLGWTSSRDQVDRAIELLADASDAASAA